MLVVMDLQHHRQRVGSYWLHLQGTFVHPWWLEHSYFILFHSNGGDIWGNSKISKALTALRSLASDQAELTDFFLYFMTSVEASTRFYHRFYHR